MSGPDPHRTLAGLGEDALLARIFPPPARRSPACCSGRATTPRWSPRPAAASSRPPTRWCGPGLARRLVHRRRRRRQGRRAEPRRRRGDGRRADRRCWSRWWPSRRPAVAWVVDFARGLGEAARAAGVPVVGGDLSSAPEGTLVVSVTALGDLDGRAPGAALRGAGRGTWSRWPAASGARRPGWLLLQRGAEAGRAPCLVDYHRRPTPDRRRRAGGRRGRCHRDARRQRRAAPRRGRASPGRAACAIDLDRGAAGAGRGGARGRRGGARTPAGACSPAARSTRCSRRFPAGAALPRAMAAARDGRARGRASLIDGAPQGPGGGWDHFGG